MAKFDQRGQQVTNQVNAETIGSVNFESIQNKEELIAELRKLLSEVNKSIQAGVIKEKDSIDIESHLKKALLEMNESAPKKAKIFEHLEGAKVLLESIASATGLVTALTQVIKIAGEFFR